MSLPGTSRANTVRVRITVSLSTSGLMTLARKLRPTWGERVNRGARRHHTIVEVRVAVAGKSYRDPHCGGRGSTSLRRHCFGGALCLRVS